MNLPLERFGLVAASVLVASLLLSAAAMADERVRVLAVSQESAPGGAELFWSFNEPALNDQGQVAYFARLANPNGQNNGQYGIFVSDRAGSKTIARTDQVAPGGSGNFGNFVFTSPSINESGQVGFDAELLNALGDPQGQHGIFRGDGQAVRYVAVEGSGFRNVAGNRINDSEKIAFWADLGSSDRYYIGDHVSRVEVVRTGVASPNGAGNIGSLRGVMHNDLQQVVYSYAISGRGLESIYLFDSGVRTEIASTGHPSPDGDGVINRFLSMSLNDFGQVAFQASLSGGTGGSALYIGNGNSLEFVARSGQSATDGNGSMVAFGDVMFNNASQVAVRTSLTGTSSGSLDDVGIFLFEGGNTRQVVREGQPTPNGQGVFGQLDQPFFADIALNDAGQIAFEAVLTGAPGAH